MLFPVVTGFLAVWYLLPTPRRRPVTGVVLAVVVAVSGFAAFLFHGLGDDLPFSSETFLFTAFSLMAFTFGILMIAQRNPARSALFFAVVVLNVCGLFLLLGAPFLMGATIIIYAGAIVVTFLFIIMLSQQTQPTDGNDRSREPSLAAAVGFVLLGALLVVLQRTWWTRDVDELIRLSDRYAKAEFLTQGEGPSVMVYKNADGHEFGDDVWQPGVQRYLAKVVRVRDQLGYGVIEIPSGENDAKDSDPVEEMRDALGLNPPAFPAPAGKNEALPRTDEVNRAAKQIRYELSYLKAVRQGRITPQITGLTLSPYGQSLPVGANDDPANAEPRRLPAANIAALGRTLFADHLIAVEMAGTLLLIATIGAIAIAGRSENAP